MSIIGLDLFENDALFGLFVTKTLFGPGLSPFSRLQLGPAHIYAQSAVDSLYMPQTAHICTERSKGEKGEK